ncbi:MAG: class I SAM-dependent methyltransferase [Sulfurimonas sp.]|jgi:SAM-dependent methyltransferase
MHTEQIAFCKSVKDKFPEYFNAKKVLDCGSLDINGNNRYLFNACEYVGIDVGEGNNVDIISFIHQFNKPDETYDTIISTECFEHDMYYEQSLQNICRLLKSKGLFFFTCATIGRPIHGTKTEYTRDSPLTSKIEVWCDYYKNLIESDIRKAIDVDNIFSEYKFILSLAPMTLKDLYFYGIKK